MEEQIEPNYAFQIALQTMKERCLQLQQRLSSVEEENMKLRLKCANTDKETIELTPIEELQSKIVQLSKQKSQLTHNVLMVATENRNLWARLSKLPNTVDLASAESVSSSQSNLIRSKTFTHENPRPKLTPKSDKHTFSDSSLEDISLKVITNIAFEKMELEKQCVQMDEMRNNESFLSNSVCFAFPQDDFDDVSVTQIVENVEKMKNVKEMLLAQQETFKYNLEMLENVFERGKTCRNCVKSKREAQVSCEKNLEDTNVKFVLDDFVDDNAITERICPMCSHSFDMDLKDFIVHVQNHFLGEDDYVFLQGVHSNI